MLLEFVASTVCGRAGGSAEPRPRAEPNTDPPDERAVRRRREPRDGPYQPPNGSTRRSLLALLRPQLAAADVDRDGLTDLILGDGAMIQVHRALPGEGRPR
jgi:hypothetical protein